METVEKIKTVIGKEQIAGKISELASRISGDYGEDDVVLICNLKGAFIFLADLCRRITSPLAIDFIATSSYKGINSTGDVRIIKDLKMDIRGKNILLVEDIIDTGYTVDYIIKYLKLHEPRSIRICTLLDKAEARKVVIDIDYIGFVVPNRFLVGYGLDYNERHRELDYIAELVTERNHSE